VSLQSALAHHGLIPEHVAVTTSLTSGRPQRRETPFGRFEYHHCPAGRLGGYRLVELPGAQQALVATPARALADLVRLVPAADSRDYLRELRLSNLEQLDLGELRDARAATPKLRRAASVLAALRAEEGA
jgi:hypothetical protein